LPAALIPADVRRDAAARADKDVMVIKQAGEPASLRALLAQWRAAAPALPEADRTRQGRRRFMPWFMPWVCPLDVR